MPTLCPLDDRDKRGQSLGMHIREQFRELTVSFRGIDDRGHYRRKIVRTQAANNGGHDLHHVARETAGIWSIELRPQLRAGIQQQGRAGGPMAVNGRLGNPGAA